MKVVAVFVLPALALALSCALFVTAGGASPNVETTGRWVLTDLGSLGTPSSEATTLNGRGHVIGDLDTLGKSRGFLWQKGRMVALATLGGDARVSAINERGDVIGSSWVTNDSLHAVLWQGGKVIDLGTLGGSRSWANAINDRGQVVGGSEVANGATHAFLWQDGKMTDLGTFGGWSSEATAINERGQVVGWSRRPPTGGPFAFVWQNGRMRALSSRRSRASAINERKEIVGWGQFSSPEDTHAVLWRKGKMIDLGRAGGGVSEAWAINERSQVIAGNPPGGRGFQFVWKNGRRADLRGFSVSAAFADMTSLINDRGEIAGATGRSAAVWQNGSVVKLPGLPGAKFSDARAINEREQVVGWSMTKDGERRAVLWSWSGARRAIERRALWMAEDAARELPELQIEDALQLVHLYAERGSHKYERAALRWLERYLNEGTPRLQHFAEVTVSLAKRELEAGGLN